MVEFISGRSLSIHISRRNWSWHLIRGLVSSSTTCPLIKVHARHKPWRSAAAGSCYCLLTAPISIPSRWPSRNSRPTCDASAATCSTHRSVGPSSKLSICFCLNAKCFSSNLITIPLSTEVLFKLHMLSRIYRGENDQLSPHQCIPSARAIF